jgi:FAD/FMN-containing dehydrogenase
VKDVVNVAWENDVQIVTGNCNGVGHLGSALGGGYGVLCGIHGLSIDNMLSLTVVMADGKPRNITPADEDLWWAMRGAGPNFGVVTSAVVKAYPIPRETNVAFEGVVIFTPDKLEEVVQWFQDTEIDPSWKAFLVFSSFGPPTFDQVIMVSLWYYGNEREAKETFKELYDISPVQEVASMKPYNLWNAGADAFCALGGRKGFSGAAHSKMDLGVFRSIQKRHSEWIKRPGAGMSVIMTEAYSDWKSESFEKDSSSYAWRGVRFHTFFIPWYTDNAMDDDAQKIEHGVRDDLRSIDGPPYKS